MQHENGHAQSGGLCNRAMPVGRRSSLSRAGLIFLSLIVATATATATQLANAQDFPSKPIRIIVPIPPGSTIDIIGRIIATTLTKAMGQQVVVDNRPGASGMIALTAAAKAPPDGYTLAIVALGQLVQTPAVLHPNVPFDPIKDFAAVSLLATGPVVMAAHPSLPVKNVTELVNLAKRRPGQLNFGSNGVGTANHVVAEMFKLLTNTEIVHVPYKGNVEAINGLIVGEVSIAFTGVPPVVGLAKAGRLRVLVTTGPRRIAIFPEVPTMAEVGLRDAETVFWYGATAPAATPRNIIALLNREIVKAMTLPEVRQVFSQQGLDPETNSPDEFAQLIRDDYARWTKIIRAAGIRFQ